HRPFAMTAVIRPRGRLQRLKDPAVAEAAHTPEGRPKRAVAVLLSCPEVEEQEPRALGLALRELARAVFGLTRKVSDVAGRHVPGGNRLRRPDLRIRGHRAERPESGEGQPPPPSAPPLDGESGRRAARASSPLRTLPLPLT